MSRKRRLTFLRVLLSTLGLLLLAALPAGAQAHDHPRERHVAPDGRRFDFSENGVWRARAREVRQVRERLRAERRYHDLNAPARTYGAPLGAMGATGASPQASWGRASAAAVTGTLRPPTILVAYADTDLESLYAPADYDRLLFGTDYPNRPYTLRALYEEMSGGLFSIRGEVLGWVRVPEPAAYYNEACWFLNEAGDTVKRNAIECSEGLSRHGELMTAALSALEAEGVDFSVFDGTGNGEIDVLQFILPTITGECSGPGMWAHRWSVTWANNGPFYVSGVEATNYTVQSGFGGGQGCDPDDIMPIGTIAHELGHGLGLPDLYDTQGPTAGVGYWCLMGAGSSAVQNSPAQMGAWAKEQLGWVTIRELDESEILDLGPVVTEREVILVRPTGHNPRGEYFLLENRQMLGSDDVGISNQNRPGMLVWHVDSLHIAETHLSNGVNVGERPAIHGVAIIQADGRDDLRRRGTGGGGGNSGDRSDPYPGMWTRAEEGSLNPNRTLDGESHPAWVLNHDGSPVGWGLYDIEETGRERGVENRITFDARRDGDLRPIYARADREGVEVLVDGGRHAFWSGRLRAGQQVELAIDSLTPFDQKDRAWAFTSWSNGGARVQTVHGPMEGDTLVATTREVYRVYPRIEGEGHFQGLPDSLDIGLFREPHDTLTLVAVPADGHFFKHFEGDAQHIVIRGDTAVLDMSSPLVVRAVFEAIPTLALDAVIDHLFELGALSDAEAFYLDFHGNRNGFVDIGDVLAWIERDEDPAAAAVAAEMLFEAMRRPDGPRPDTPRPARSRTLNEETH